jgi:hypothetical protein
MMALVNPAHGRLGQEDPKSKANLCCIETLCLRARARARTHTHTRTHAYKKTTKDRI